MKKIVLVVFCFFLAACGFQLRGQATLPFETLFISFPVGNPIGTDLRRFVKAGTSTRLVDNPQNAEATLEVISAVNEKQIMSVSGGGRVREFELRYRVSFRLVDAKGVELIPANEIALRRIIPFTDAQVVAKEGEEAMLVREMQSDAAAQILRRLEAVGTAEG
ncbi:MULTISPECIES: LPS assembly lipoprotein LptE [unclassified Nitrosospira]|uniref:LPS-assembly lipoprotein LptE n=1 Tax=unclassified Nitrosospira TaxID=2609267 RepID=UPI000D304C1E|nr:MULTISPECIES: LPS assembly lipoprotein LptE [unclassified Nitrosospira]PTR15715.1 LPS-assembly lipoprotein [Nitrosospira sp. Nsp2]WON74860.1 LPS assembly lipoprotein LptE [Nitrosospira sp. Is2]